MRFFSTLCACFAVSFLLEGHAAASSGETTAVIPLPSERPVAVMAALDVTDSATSLDLALSNAGLRIDEIRRRAIPVPRIFVDGLPTDMHQIDEASERKHIFLKVMLPLLLEANERILADRRHLERLETVLRAGAWIPLKDAAWLVEMSALYEVDDGDLAELLRRVDVIPVSLALAQSAIESGWGTSRFAREGNAVFGQRSWNSHEGLVPHDRDPDKTHVVKSFKDLKAAVAAYLANLNRHEAYETFRDLRAELRRRGYPLDSRILATQLDGYAEEPDYVGHVLIVIRQNRLTDFDDARLAGLAA